MHKIIQVIQHPYQDKKECCSNSLFQKGKLLKVPSKVAIMIDDFEYLNKISWKYCDGFEAPMSVYNYYELWVKIKNNYEKLPNPNKQKFIDYTTHIPYTEKHKIFIAISKEKVEGKWYYFLNIFKYDTSWKLLKQFNDNEVGRPIQFYDNDNKLILLQNNSILLLDLYTLSIEVIFTIKKGNIINCHLTSSNNFIGCIITTKNQDSDFITFVLIDEYYKVHYFQDGNNISELDINQEVLPIRTQNGMINITFTQI